MEASYEKQDPASRELQKALMQFTDFIYAAVFSLFVYQAFEEVFKKGFDTIISRFHHLLLGGLMFYLLSWDWAVGRILTLKIPYHHYSRFYWELAIAASGYGVATSAIHGDAEFLLYLSALLVAGIAWADRTSPHAQHKREKRELCVVQNVQFPVAVSLISLYFFWGIYSAGVVNWSLVLISGVQMLTALIVYESYTPRSDNVMGGPGVPFINRKVLRRFRKFMEAPLSNQIKYFFGRCVVFAGWMRGKIRLGRRWVKNKAVDKLRRDK